MKKKNKNIIGISRLADRHGRAQRLETLESREHGMQAQGATQPQTPTEIKLAATWQSALPGIPFYRETNFVAAGGDSLSLAQVIAEVESTHAINLTVEAVANNLTLKDMAALIDQMVAKLPPPR